MLIWLRCLRCLLLLVVAPSLVSNTWAAEPTPQPLPQLETGMHTAPIKRIATDAKGRWAVTVSSDKTARVWEIASSSQLVVLRPPQDLGNEGDLSAVALSPDGAVVAVGGWTGWDWDRHVSVYLFDRATGSLLQRIGKLPDAVVHLAYSPDGHYLAACLGARFGVRIFDVNSEQKYETGSDPNYRATCESAHFSPNNRQLVTTDLASNLRLYELEDGKLGSPRVLQVGHDPMAARFSPDGTLIAVAFHLGATISVVNASTLQEEGHPSIAGNGSVAWTADGKYLVAGSQSSNMGKQYVRRWPIGKWSDYVDLPLTSNSVMDLVPIGEGSVLFAAADPAWGIIGSDFKAQQLHQGVIADFRLRQIFRLSADGRQVSFGYHTKFPESRRFDIVSRTLGEVGSDLTSAGTNGQGLDIARWMGGFKPTLNGEVLKLKDNEMSRCVAVAPDGKSFVLGSSWNLRRFDRNGKEVWPQPIPSPGTTWAVNWSADGRFIVAGYGDGTIRWHRPSDGGEVLAFFPHADQKRWIAWTPEGFYAASDSDAEELMGYHLNHGKDHEGEFISARQLREHFYQPALISRRLDTDGDALIAEAVKKLGDVQQLLAGAKEPPPLVELLSDDQVTAEEEVTIKVKVKDRGGGVGGLIYYVDGVPQTGRQAGIFADGTESRTFAAAPGERRIEVAALSRNGIEGVRQVVTATFTGPARDAALHIFAVGIEKYKAPRLELRHSTADASKVAEQIALLAKPLFKRGVSDPLVLTESQASLQGIKEAFEEFKKRIKPQDTLVIFLAGHGEAPIGKGYTFLPWEFESGGEGLNEVRLRDMLAGSPAQTLLLLDTCDAGGAADMIQAAYERLNGLSRHVVIGASRRGQFAQEGFEGHGIFSAALLRVMASQPKDEIERIMNVVDISSAVDKEVRRILTKMGSSSGQRVSGFLGSAKFQLIMR